MAAQLTTTTLTVEDNARRMGHYRWAEHQLFQALGGWAGVVPEPEVAVRLAAHCHHHAWRSDLWRDRLPVRENADPDDLTAPPNEAAARFAAALIEPGAPELTIEKLTGAYRVFVPHLIAAYAFHQRHTSDVTDPPTARTLRLALHDAQVDWVEGEMLLQSLLRTTADVQRTAAHQAMLETLLVEAGGIAGPGTIG